ENHTAGRAFESRVGHPAVDSDNQLTGKRQRRARMSGGGAPDIEACCGSLEAIVLRLRGIMNNSTLVGYLPIFLFMGLAFLFPVVTLMIAKLIRPQCRC